MVWPTTKTPQGLSYSQTLDRTLLGEYYDEDNVKKFNLWHEEPCVIKCSLKSIDFWKTLPDDVITKYSTSSYATVRRIFYLWRGIEANIIASNLGLLDQPLCPLHKMLFRWCITNGIHSYDATCQVWKKLTLHILHYCNKVTGDNINEFPSSLPGGVNHFCGPLWFEMLPWLGSFALMKVSENSDHITATDLESVGYIIQTRMMPPPPITDERFEVELIELRKQFEKVAIFTEEMVVETRLNTGRFLAYVRNALSKKPPRPHISLTTNGCYESPRSEGGRALYVCKKFIEKNVKCNPTVLVTTETWWGAPIIKEPGVQAYKTTCRTSKIESNFRFLSSTFRDDNAPGGVLHAAMARVDSETKIEGPILGLDEALPHQILQLSIEECCEKGYLPGPPTKWTPEQALRDSFIRSPVNCDLMFLSEPGNKVRALVKTPSCVTIALQPFAHWLEGVVSSYPSLRSAFTRSYKGWDFAVSAMRDTNQTRVENEGISVFDLKGASNGLNPQFLRHICSKIVHDICTSQEQVFYYSQMLELLLAPRRVRVKRHQEDTVHRVILTCNGIQMGDPGTKELLCLSSAILELMVYPNYAKPPITQIAGDDIIGLRNEAGHKGIVSKHRQYGNEINDTKTQWSTIFVWYCEELVRYIAHSIASGCPPWKSNYKTHNLHLDICKMRLLSPFSPGSNDQAAEKNPALGKGDALWEFIQNSQRAKLTDYIRCTFFNWMSSFIKNDPLIFLPRFVGGNNVPYVGDREELYRRIMEEIPFIAKIYTIKAERADIPALINVITRRMSSGLTTRGIIDPMTPFASMQIAHICYQNFKSRSRTLKSLTAELQSKKNYSVTIRDSIRYAKSEGYVSYADIAEDLDRAVSLRASMACAAGAIPIDDILPSKRDVLPSPTEVLKTFLEKELPSARHLYGASLEDFKMGPEDVSSFRAWFLKGAPNVVPVAQSIWIPKEAIDNSLMGMTIKIPFSKSKKRTPGSTLDEFRSTSISEGSREIINFKRIKKS
jgi:hypothetical protein